MGSRLFQENGSLSISFEDSIQNYFFIKHFLSILKISKTFDSFLRMTTEYIYRFIQGSLFKILFQGSVVKTDPCWYLLESSPDVLKKKTRVLDMFNMDKKCFIKIDRELCPQEIWIRIRFLEINGSPSLIKSKVIILLIIWWLFYVYRKNNLPIISAESALRLQRPVNKR